MRIGVDLDGVLINTPPFVPGWVIEWLYRGTKQKKLHYRIPHSGFEIWVRQLSHFPLFRPPMTDNIEKLRQLAQSGEHELFLVTSRFSFLREKTNAILIRYGLNKLFKEVILNLNNEQPHIFKQKTIERLKLDMFIDDDEDLLDFLKEKLPNTKFVTAPSK